jgi:hypothetical protein
MAKLLGMVVCACGSTALGRQKQDHEFQAIPNYIVRLCLKKTKNKTRQKTTITITKRS